MTHLFDDVGTCLPYHFLATEDETFAAGMRLPAVTKQRNFFLAQLFRLPAIM
jgi:hypothetical protein